VKNHDAGAAYAENVLYQCRGNVSWLSPSAVAAVLPGMRESALAPGRHRTSRRGWPLSDTRYISTRGEAPELGFEDVVLAGLARDGGLYVPSVWPHFERDEIAGFAGRPFHEIAAAVIAPFASGAFTREELTGVARDAYSGFGHTAVTPIAQLTPHRFVLELFHGPTLAFKDVAMQFLSRLMDRILAARRARATIVCATSGDTGGAAVEAFRGAHNVDIVVLFPEGRVSDVQRRMMTTPDEDNVHALSIRGTFDDCQALVKAMFNDLAFRDRVALSGVNSINWARVVPQVSYYFAAAVALGAPHRPVSFTVPTGNFGDIFAGYVARRMGLPIQNLTIASNENDILPRTLETGSYEKHAVVATTSPSMDIQISSNFERVLFEATERDAALIRSWMASLAQSGRFELGETAKYLRQEFLAAAASEPEVADAIVRTRADTGYVLEPHTACGVIASEKTGAARSVDVPDIVLATAHPAKFPEAMRQITGAAVPLPPRLAHFMELPERMTSLDNDLAAVQQYILKHTRSVNGS
jgi:threonine synthase